MGERYGWSQNDGFSHDENLSNAFKKASSKYSWINKYKDRSISELEIIYGALQPELSITNNKENSNPRCFFFFRDPLSITKRFELGDPERKNYEEESSDGHRKLRELKDRIRNSSLPLVDGYNNDNLSNYLLDALTAVINQDFPMDEEAAKSNLLAKHKAAPSSVFYKNENIFKAFRSYILSSGKAKSLFHFPCVIQGPEGCGKATNLIHWLTERMSMKHEKEIILTHFVRENSLSNYFCGKQIAKLLSDSFDISLDSFSSMIDDDVMRIAFFSIFDAIDYQLQKQGKYLILALPGTHLLPSISWLPDKIPSTIKLFITCKSNLYFLIIFTSYLQIFGFLLPICLMIRFGI